MARSLNDLANYLERLAIRLPEQRSNELSKRAATVILTDLVAVTPVDTSKAISNWQVSLGSPSHIILPPYVPGKGGSTALASKDAALAVGKQIIEAKGPEQALFISNALPYIRRLNEGWSKQAPAGFVERAILLGRLVSEGRA